MSAGRRTYLILSLLLRALSDWLRRQRTTTDGRKPPLSNTRSHTSEANYTEVSIIHNYEGVAYYSYVDIVIAKTYIL